MASATQLINHFMLALINYRRKYFMPISKMHYVGESGDEASGREWTLSGKNMSALKVGAAPRKYSRCLPIVGQYLIMPRGSCRDEAAE